MLNDPILLNDWHVVARASEVTSCEVKAARLLGEDLVLWHDGDSMHVWRDRCCHRGARLSLGSVQDRCLVCAYHGWRYDTAGTCVLVPAHPGLSAANAAKAEAYRVRVKYGLVWVCLGTPLGDVPAFPEWDDPSYRSVGAGPYRFRAYGTRVLENFLDAGHYPFVHSGFMGGSGQLEITDYGVEETDTGPVARDVGVRRIWREGPGGTGEVDVRYTFRVQRPLTAHYSKAHGAERFAMLDTITPVDEAESLVWSIMAVNYPTGKTDADLVAYQDTVTCQDVPIVESQRPQLLPLGGGEVNVPSDRLSVAYRRWLKAIGLGYGVM